MLSNTEKTMDKMYELSPEQMGQVTGGVIRYINTGIAGKDAAIRNGASTSAGWIDHLPTGYQVDTVTDQVVFDPVSRRNFVEINYIKDGVERNGWVAASIVGLPR